MPFLVWCLLLASCSPNRDTDKRSTFATQPAAAPSSTLEPNSKTGSLQISLSQELSSSIAAALLEGGLSDAQVQAVTTEVTSTGVLAIETGAGLHALEPHYSLLATLPTFDAAGYSLAEQTSALQTAAPSVAGAYVASLDTATAGLSEETRKKAIAIITKATFDFTGKKSVEETSRSTLLGDIAQKVVEKSAEASLSPDGMVDTVGLIADATFSHIEKAGIPAASIGDTAKSLGAKISEGLGNTGIQADRIPTALGRASERASTALGKLSLADPVAAVGSTTEGFVSGLAANTSVSREVRMAAIAEVPKGISAAVPAWLPAEKLESAVAQVTSTSFSAFVSKWAPTATEISEQVPRLAEGSVAGLTKSGMTTAALADSHITAKPFQAIVEKLDTVGLDSTTRLKVMENTLSKSIAALATSSDANNLNTVGPPLVSRAFEVATTSRAKLGIDQTEAKVTSFYDMLLNGAIGGLAKAGSTQQANTANAASSVLARTMDAAVSSLNSMYTGSGAAISENILKSIPTRAAQSAGEKLATVLSPDDLYGAFATVTTQYLYNVQSVVATKATNVDVSDLTKKVTATSLASFSGAFNARPVDMQTAVTALNNKMGVVGSGMDAKVLAAVQGGTQEIVVNAVQAAGSIPRCSGATPHSSLVVCSKVSTDICLLDSSENGYNLKWVADGSGERCFLYRELAVTTSQAVTCASDSEYVYGIGCRRKVSTCAAGETFIYGVGCQAGTYFCPMGQKFLAGQGCVADATNYSQCSTGTRRAADGTCVPIVATNCSIGATFNTTTKQCDAGATPQCPAGSIYNANISRCTLTIATNTSSSTAACTAGFYHSTSGTCLPFGRCDTGSYWDPSSMSCKSSSSCTGNFQWDTATNTCRAVDLIATLCSAGQYWDPASQQCKPTSMCDASAYWDTAARVCRPNGTCTIGFVYNAVLATCDAVAQATVSECLSTAPSPGNPSLTVNPTIQSLSLTWAPTIGEAPSGYLLVRWDSSAGTLSLTDGKAYNIGETVGSGSTLGKIIFRGKESFFNDFAASDTSKEYAYSLFAANFPCTGPKYSTATSVSGQKPLPALAGVVTPPVGPSYLSASSETDNTFQKRALLKWNAPLYLYGAQSIEPDFVIARIDDASVSFAQPTSFFAVNGQPYGQGSTISNSGTVIGMVVFSGKLWRNSDGSQPNYAFLDNQTSGAISGRYVIAARIGTGASAVYSSVAEVDYSAPNANEAVSVPPVTNLSVSIPQAATKPRVEWSPINGASGYIIARAPSSLAALPSLVNDTFYDVNQNIVVGGQTVAMVIGKMGQTLVDDLSVTLSPGNAYIYLVYTASMIDGKPKYSPASSFTFVTPPSVPTASSITSNTATLAWMGQNPASNPRIKYLLVRYPGHSMDTTAPSLNQEYAAALAFGSGSVVGYLSSLSFTDSGLTGSTSFEYRVFTAFDVTPPNGQRILVYSGPQMLQVSTLAPAPVGGGPTKIIWDGSSVSFSTKCEPQTITLRDDSNNLVNAAAATMVALTSSNPGVTFFHDAQCGTAIPGTTISAGQNSATFFIKAAAGLSGAATFTANTGSVSGTSSLSIANITAILTASDLSVTDAESLSTYPIVEVIGIPTGFTASYSVGVPSTDCPAVEGLGGIFNVSTPLPSSLTAGDNIVCVKLTSGDNSRIAFGRSPTIVRQISGNTSPNQLQVVGPDTLALNQCVPFSLNALKSDGTSAPVGGSSLAVALNIESGASNKNIVYLNSTCSIPATFITPSTNTVSIPAGASSLSFYVKTFENKLFTIKAQASGYNDGIFSFAAASSGDATSIQGNSSKPVIDRGFCQQVTIGLANASGNPATWGSSLTVNLSQTGSAALYATSDCNGTPVFSLTFGLNQALQRVFMKDAESEDFLLLVNAANGWNSALAVSVGQRVFAGAQHTCTVDTQGQAKCWGANSFGQIGNGTTTDLSNIPAAGLSIPNRQVKTMALGADFTCALLDNHEVRCWGANGMGQLGLNNTTQLTSPSGTSVSFGPGRSARAIAAGGSHVCAILDDQSLSCWGNGVGGQLGIGSVSSPTYRPTPQTVTLGSGIKVKSVKAGNAHTCVILHDNTVKCWGTGLWGQLGSGANTNVASALSAPTVQSGGGALTAKAIALGGQHTCTISATGSLSCWGDHASGQLGIGAGNTSYGTPQIVSLAAGEMPKSLSLGGQHSCVVLSSNNVKCFGDNLSGRVVRGDNTASFNTPVPIAPDNAAMTIYATGVALGYGHTCAVNLSANTINCWGDNSKGQLGGTP